MEDRAGELAQLRLRLEHSLARLEELARMREPGDQADALRGVEHLRKALEELDRYPDQRRQIYLPW